MKPGIQAGFMPHSKEREPMKLFVFIVFILLLSSHIHPESKPIELSGHTGLITHCQFSHNGALVLTCSRDKSIKIWSSETGELLHTLNTKDTVLSATFALNDDKVISYSTNNQIIIWDVENGQEIKQISGFLHRMNLSRNYRAPSFAYTKPWVVFLSKDRNRIIIWDFSKNITVKSIASNDMLRAPVISSDAKILVAGTEKTQIVRAWNIESEEVISQYRANPDLLTINSSGRVIIGMARGDRFEKQYEPTGSYQLTEKGFQNTAAPSNQASSSRVIQSFRLVGSKFKLLSKCPMIWRPYEMGDAGFNNLEFYHGKTREDDLYVYPKNKQIESLCFSPDEKLMMTSSGYLTILREVETGKAYRCYLNGQDDTHSPPGIATFVPGKPWFIVPKGKEGSALCNYETKKLLQVFEKGSLGCHVNAVSPDGKTLLLRYKKTAYIHAIKPRLPKKDNSVIFSWGW